MGDGPAGTLAPAKVPGSARTSQMVNCLRVGLIYSEKRARDIVFRAVEDILKETDSARTPLIVSRLTREAAVRARQAGTAAGFAFRNWDMTARAVVRAMLGARVLISAGGSAIAPGIAAQATGVAGIRSGFRDITEAYLLEFLIRRLGDVTVRDHTALAHALLRQFDPGVPREDLEDRVVVLLAMLAGRVVLESDGTYHAAGPS